MPEDNAARVRSMYDAFSRGDVPFVIGLFDPQIEWREADNFIYPSGPYVGPQAVLEGVFQRLAVDWEGFAAVPDEILPSGDTVISLGHYHGTYKATGKRANAQFVHVFQLRNGKVFRFQQYTDTAQFRDVVSRSAAAR